MTWTREQQLRALVRLPWTVRSERNATEGYLVARVVELPSVIATGANETDLEKDFWDALEATLETFLEHGDPIPLPRGQKLPWEQDRPKLPEVRRLASTMGDAWASAQQIVPADATASDSPVAPAGAV